MYILVMKISTDYLVRPDDKLRGKPMDRVAMDEFPVGEGGIEPYADNQEEKSSERCVTKGRALRRRLLSCVADR